jgi:hypothetical protein
MSSPGAAVLPRVVEEHEVALDVAAEQAPFRTNGFSAGVANVRRAWAGVRDCPLGQPVRPSPGAVQYGDYLNNVAFDPVGDDVRRARDDELARARDAARSGEGGRCRQARHRRPNSLDHAACRGRLSAAMRS